MRFLPPASAPVAALTCLLAVLASTPASASEDFDGGGRVGDYMDLVSHANMADQSFEIGGVCASACTLKLGARKVCIRPEAQLWFHAARNPDGRVNALGTLLLLQDYPRAIRTWAISHGALASTQFTTMSGAQAISLGVPNCERAENTAQNYTPRPTVAGGFSPVRSASYSVAMSTPWSHYGR